MSSVPLIAIVQNDLADPSTLSRLLADNGYEVATFRSAERFLEVSDDLRPDCVLIDIHLGAGERGFDLARELATRDRRTPFILMTMSLHPSHAERAAELGSRHLLHKPFDDEELLSALRYVLTVPN
jgi:chemosensory pili system protein ChpA (sensor histidine kinase/response regulator)